MALFPAFLDIKGKNCVVVGGGKVAARKIETLMKFEPDITVVSPEICESIQQLRDENKVRVINKKYSGEDIETAFIVIAATDNSNVNNKVHMDARNRGILVNVADSPESCTFVFPSVIVREDMVVGITTSGGFPALSKKVREKLENAIPAFYGEILKILKTWRRRAEQEIHDAGARKAFINRILDEITPYENAMTSAQLSERIEEIFEEYDKEQQRDISKKQKKNL